MDADSRSEPERIEASFRHGTHRPPSASSPAFSLGFLTAWGANPIPWGLKDLFALVPLVVGVIFEMVAVAKLLDPRMPRDAALQARRSASSSPAWSSSPSASPRRSSSTVVCDCRRRRLPSDADAAVARPRDPADARTPRRPQRMPRSDIAEAFRRFAAANPEPKGELHYTNPFTLLVAVVLSAQATDAGVNKATPALFAKADTPEKMVSARRGEGHRAHPHHRPLPHQGAERRGAVAEARSPSTAARCRPTARRWRRCRASGARPPTSS